MDFETRAIHAGPGARSGDRRDHHADLPDLDVRTGRGRRAQGLRLLARRESDSHRAREWRSQPRGRRARHRVLVRSRRDDDDHASRRSGRARRPDRRRLRRRLPHDLTGVRAEGLPLRLRAGGRVPRTCTRISTRTRASCGSRLRRTRCSTSWTSERLPTRRTQSARSSSSTTRSPRRTCSSRSMLGADIVVHSTTKYLGGHSDMVGGFVATNDPALAERLRFLQKSLGAVPGPFDSWLVLRGIKTLAVRMRQHCENAQRGRCVARAAPATSSAFSTRACRAHPVTRSPPADARLRRDGLVPRRDPRRKRSHSSARTKLFQLAESLGGVESLIEQPARMTHASTADAPFAAPRNLVRLSVGIEAVDDLIADLEPRSSPAAASASREPERSTFFPRAASASDRRATSLDTEDGPALFDCGPATTHRRAEERPRPSTAPSSPTCAICCSRHIHLDHAGAAGALVREHPGLQVQVSEIGAPHLIDPNGWSAARGGCTATPSTALGRARARTARRTSMSSATASLGLDCFPTPGHASHHVSYLTATERCMQATPRACASLPGRAVLPAYAAARHRTRAVAADDRGDRAARPRPARPDPLRRRGRPTAPPGRAAPRAVRLGGFRPGRRERG